MLLCATVLLTATCMSQNVNKIFNVNQNVFSFYATCLNMLFDHKGLIYYVSLTMVNTPHHTQ